ncbi:ABC transporter permease [Intrasporangium sp. DVR]|uniref:ABC transporter permease n=1 Tax=Intrasporangium sp. DVR TaxID=3127867 RepID=UPI00313A59E2
MVMTEALSEASTTDRTDSDHPEGSRWAQWRSSWRVALRMARRDVRRHKGRSVLIALMVALPVVALVGGAVLYATSDLDAKERLPFALGGAQASLYYVPGASVAVQDANLEGMGNEQAPAKPIPGFGPGSEAAALSALTGGRVTAVTNASAIVSLESRVHRVDYLGIDGANWTAGGERVRLLTGRWPASPDEVIVTKTGIDQGLPSSGTMRLRIEGADHEVRDLTVVGTGSGFVQRYGHVARAEIIGLPTTVEVFDNIGPEYLLDRPEPVLADEVKRLNQHGILVLSRAVVTDPSSLSPVIGLEDADFRQRKDVQFAGVAALAGVGLLLLTSLLAGPAFAVSAARQRRTLALAASNGAERRQLRRTVLGQALVLGVGATFASLALGVAGAWAVVTWLRGARPAEFFGPFDIPWLAVIVVVVAAVVSSVVSALLPAKGLARLDIVAVLRGQNVSPRLRRRVPAAGLFVAAVGAAATLWGATGDSPNTVAAGSVALVLGTLLIVPLLLLWLARLTGRAPVAVRMATREAARQRGRATPTVAAILAGAAALCTILVGFASSTALDARFYVPSTAAGAGVVTTQHSTDHVLRLVRDAAPGVSATPMWRAAAPFDPMTAVGGQNEVHIDAARRGCKPGAGSMDPEVTTGADGKPLPPTTTCATLGTMPYGQFSAIAVADAALLAQRLALTPEQVQVLESGGLVAADGKGIPEEVVPMSDGWTTNPPHAQVDIVDGTVSFERYVVTWADRGPEVSEVSPFASVPAAYAPRTAFATAFPNRDVGAVMTPETAKKTGFPLNFSSIALDSPGGVTAADEDAIRAALGEGAPDSDVYVERGFRPETALVFTIAVGVVGFIILVATLIATALSQAEGQAMSGTLAAVGATRLTRRSLAAAQAGLFALLGMVLGVLVGLVPGVAVAWSSTVTSWQARQNGLTDPIIVIPWAQLLAPVVVVPLLAAAVAWVSIRRHPTVTRRLT